MEGPGAGPRGTAPSGAGFPDSGLPARRPRKQPTSSRLLRLAILIAVLVVLIVVLVLGVRSCQTNRKVESYRSYLGAVATAIDDSAALGKQLGAIVAAPADYSREELTAKLKEMTAAQVAIADRTAALVPPQPLTEEQAVLAQGMRVRAEGYSGFEKAMLAALNNQTVSSASITALEGYLSGPDAYYMSLFYTQAQATMKQEDVAGVAVPTSDSYLSANTLDSVSVQTMLDSISSSAKLIGRHGVALVRVTAQPEDIELATNLAATVTVTPELAFEVRVQNQGDVEEANVPVKGQLTLPDGAVLTQNTTLAALPAGETATATLKDFAIPSGALNEISRLEVEVGPVNGERVVTNNSGSFSMRLLPQ